MSTVYRSTEPCWRCGEALVRLEPPTDGWSYYCRRCEHLTLTRAQCDAAWRSIGAGAIGAVVAVTRRLRIAPPTPHSTHAPREEENV
jgi:hypothetical protein